MIFAYEICEQSSICFALWQGFGWGWGGAGWEVECTGHLSKQGKYLHISSAIYIDIDMSVNYTGITGITQLDNMSISMHTARQTPRHFVAPIGSVVSLCLSLSLSLTYVWLFVSCA